MKISGMYHRVLISIEANSVYYKSLYFRRFQMQLKAFESYQIDKWELYFILTKSDTNNTTVILTLIVLYFG